MDAVRTDLSRADLATVNEPQVGSRPRGRRRARTPGGGASEELGLAMEERRGGAAKEK